MEFSEASVVGRKRSRDELADGVEDQPLFLQERSAPVSKKPYVGSTPTTFNDFVELWEELIADDVAESGGQIDPDHSILLSEIVRSLEKEISQDTEDSASAYSCTGDSSSACDVLSEFSDTDDSSSSTTCSDSNTNGFGFDSPMLDFWLESSFQLTGDDDGGQSPLSGYHVGSPFLYEAPIYTPKYSEAWDEDVVRLWQY